MRFIRYAANVTSAAACCRAHVRRAINNRILGILHCLADSGVGKLLPRRLLPQRAVLAALWFSYRVRNIHHFAHQPDMQLHTQHKSPFYDMAVTRLACTCCTPGPLKMWTTGARGRTLSRWCSLHARALCLALAPDACDVRQMFMVCAGGDGCDFAAAMPRNAEVTTVISNAIELLCGWEPMREVRDVS